MARFVFLHGAWHGGWCFGPLARELDRRGHAVTAPDLPCEDVSAGVVEYAETVGPQPDAVVVAHALGGLTLPLVEARCAVFLAALVPSENVVEAALDPRFEGQVHDALGRSYWPSQDVAVERLYPDVDANTVAWAYPRLRSQARLGPLEVEAPHGPRASIVTLRDQVVRPEWQQWAAGALLGVEPFELDAGHWAMLTHPVELADLLEQVA